jgi:catechol 2,3-dioxygenase-like lactoylglutathione lyase family enzyme
MNHSPEAAMSANEVRRNDASIEGVDMKLEVVVIPVSDVDRAKEFYGRLGWRLDADFPFDNGFRVVQFTPPGSGCSVQFGTNITSAAPGSAQGLYLIVSDVEAFFVDLRARNGLLPVSSPGPFRLPQGINANSTPLTSLIPSFLLGRHVPAPGVTSTPYHPRGAGSLSGGSNRGVALKRAFDRGQNGSPASSALARV